MILLLSFLRFKESFIQVLSLTELNQHLDFLKVGVSVMKEKVILNIQLVIIIRFNRNKCSTPRAAYLCTAGSIKTPKNS